MRSALTDGCPLKWSSVFWQNKSKVKYSGLGQVLLCEPHFGMAPGYLGTVLSLHVNFV